MTAPSTARVAPLSSVSNGNAKLANTRRRGSSRFEQGTLEVHFLWSWLLVIGGLGHHNFANNRKIFVAYMLCILTMWGCSWYTAKAMFYGTKEFIFMYLGWTFVCMNMTFKFICLINAIKKSAGDAVLLAPLRGLTTQEKTLIVKVQKFCLMAVNFPAVPVAFFYLIAHNWSKLSVVEKVLGLLGVPPFFVLFYTAFAGTGSFFGAALAIVKHQDHFVKLLTTMQAQLDNDLHNSDPIDLTEAYRGAAALETLITRFTSTWGTYFLGAEFPMVLSIGCYGVAIYIQINVGVSDAAAVFRLIISTVFGLMIAAITWALFYLPSRIDQRNSRIMSAANTLKATLGYKGRPEVKALTYFHSFLVECKNKSVFAPAGIAITFSLALSLFYGACSLLLGLSLSMILSNVQL